MEVAGAAAGVGATGARVGHAQAVLGSKLYVFGGRAGVEMGESELGDLWAFDADGGSWEELRAPNVPSPRSFHAATSANGRLYVFGGCGADGRMADLHAYDAAANRWTALPSPPADVVGRGGATLEAAAAGDALWLACGFAGHETNDLLRFDLRAEVWERVPSDWLRPRSVVASLSLPRALLLFGGEVSPSDRGHEGAGGFAADLVAVDPAGGAPLDVAVDGPPAWAPPARGWAAAAALSPTRGLLFGGLAGSDAAPRRSVAARRRVAARSWSEREYQFLMRAAQERGTGSDRNPPRTRALHRLRGRQLQLGPAGGWTGPAGLSEPKRC